MAIKIATHSFAGKTVSYYFDADFSYLEQIVSRDSAVLVTDEHLYRHQYEKFAGWKTIVIKAGEEHKQQATVDQVLQQLIAFEADRKTFIVGIGGGVVTDITGYAASVYMRGLKFGFIPTTILAMVDASIGGKNGVDVGIYKNLAGVIRQPEFLLYDYSLLQSLPSDQWINGFAEIIKHACIKDASMFALLEQESPEAFRADPAKLSRLVEANAQLKTNVVILDEFENGDRRLLNFGHTVGHAIENHYDLPHGHAVSIGMAIACRISERINGLDPFATERVVRLIEHYGLPAHFEFDREKIWDILKMDKKRAGSTMNFILLNRIGEAVVTPIPTAELKDLINYI